MDTETGDAGSLPGVVNTLLTRRITVADILIIVDKPDDRPVSCY